MFFNPLHKQANSWENDIYSFGMILYFLVTGGIYDCDQHFMPDFTH